MYFFHNGTKMGAHEDARWGGSWWQRRGEEGRGEGSWGSSSIQELWWEMWELGGTAGKGEACRAECLWREQSVAGMGLGTMVPGGRKSWWKSRAPPATLVQEQRGDTERSPCPGAAGGDWKPQDPGKGNFGGVTAAPEAAEEQREGPWPALDAAGEAQPLLPPPFPSQGWRRCLPGLSRCCCPSPASLL